MATVSTHILNAVDGTHASGIPVSLVHLETGKVLVASETDESGRLKIEVDLSDVREQIAQASRAKDEEVMRSSTHVLISVAGAVGAVRLQGQAEKLNALANQGDLTLIEGMSDDALAELDGVMAFIQTKVAEGAG